MKLVFTSVPSILARPIAVLPARRKVDVLTLDRDSRPTSAYKIIVCVATVEVGTPDLAGFVVGPVDVLAGDRHPHTPVPVVMKS
jgi:hypothetical protein